MGEEANPRRPTVKQIYALAAALCERNGEQFPQTVAEASPLLDRLRGKQAALWEDGLALPARLALERARVAGLGDAEQAIADLELRGARTPIARAIVRRLAEDLLTEMGLQRRGEVVPLRHNEA